MMGGFCGESILQGATKALHPYVLKLIPLLSPVYVL